MCYNTIRHACGSRIRRQSLSCSCGTNGGDRECSLRCGTCHQCGHAAGGVAPMTRITTNTAVTETSKPDPDDAAASDAAGSASTTATTSPTASSPTAAAAAAAAAAGMPKLFPVSGVAAAAAAMASSGPAKVRSADARYSYP